MKNLHIYILLLIATSFITCEEEKKHPEIETLSAEIISLDKFLLKGEIINRGEYKIHEIGFIGEFSCYEPYDDEIHYYYDDSSVQIEGTEDNEFEVELEVGKSYKSCSKQYFNYRLYVRNEIGTVYGNSMYLEVPEMKITGISTTAVYKGDTLSIYGEYFSENKEDISVRYSSMNFEVVSSGPNEIRVKIPDTFYSSSYDKQLTVYCKNHYAYYDVKISKLHHITDFMPTSGKSGTVVKIYGEGFGTSMYNTYIYFNDTQAILKYITNNRIEVYVPQMDSEGNCTISVSLNNAKVTATENFKYINE